MGNRDSHNEYSRRQAQLKAFGRRFDPLSTQLELNLATPVRGLQDDSERIQRGTRAARCCGCIDSGQLQLPAGGSISGEASGHLLTCALNTYSNGLGAFRRRHGASVLDTVAEFVDAEGDPIPIIVIRAVIDRAQRQDRTWAYHERQAEKAMLFVMPGGAFQYLA